jgi:hypothetical protein
MRSRADQFTRPHAAHGLHISFVHTHVQAQPVRLLGAPAAPCYAAAATMQRSQRYRTGLCLCWGFRQPATQRGARERARWGARAARTHLHRTRGLAAPDARPASSDLYCPRASAAPGLAAPLSAPAAASAPRRGPMMRSSAPRCRRRRPPPRCGRNCTHRARSTRSPPHPAAKLKVAGSSPRFR